MVLLVYFKLIVFFCLTINHGPAFVFQIYVYNQTEKATFFGKISAYLALTLEVHVSIKKAVLGEELRTDVTRLRTNVYSEITRFG